MAETFSERCPTLFSTLLRYLATSSLLFERSSDARRAYPVAQPPEETVNRIEYIQIPIIITAITLLRQCDPAVSYNARIMSVKLIVMEGSKLTRTSRVLHVYHVPFFRSLSLSFSLPSFLSRSLALSNWDEEASTGAPESLSRESNREPARYNYSLSCSVLLGGADRAPR